MLLGKTDSQKSVEELIEDTAKEGAVGDNEAIITVSLLHKSI